MRYYKAIVDEYLVSVGTGAGGEEITEAEYNNLLGIIHNKPTAENGYDYRLTENLEWERYELPIIPPEDEEATTEDYEEVLADETGYTKEQLTAMSNAELEAVCAELGIVPTKNKANMIVLILSKQRGD